MSGLARKMQRAADRLKPEAERRWPRGGSISKLGADGSITVLRATKGWLRTSPARVRLRIEQAKHVAALMARTAPTEGAPA